MTSLPSDPYRALGVDRDADISAIKTAYRKLVLKCHPDKVQDPKLKAVKQDEFQRVQQAYEILADEGKRREYDDDVKLRKLRDELAKSAAAQPSPRASTKTYYEYNIKTAEPPASFRPGPPPGSHSYSPYSSTAHHTSAPFERESSSKSKPIYEEDRKARRAGSYEKATRRDEEIAKERRRKEDDDERQRRRDREDRDRERERERERERKRDKEREKEREERKQRERDDRKRAERAAAERELLEKEMKRIKKERERTKEEGDRRRRQEQDEKRTKKTYIEDESEEERVVTKKKSSSSTKKASHDSPRRDKSARRDESPRAIEVDVGAVKKEKKLMDAYEYMQAARRKSSKSSPTGHLADPSFSSPNFQNPDNWKPTADSPRVARRSSQDDKYATLEEMDEDDPRLMSAGPSDPRVAPGLRKSYTSPIGHSMSIPLHSGPPLHANSAAPRMPQIVRAQTMAAGYSLQDMVDEPTRHSSKSERRRRGSDDYDEEPRSHRSSGRPAAHAPRVLYAVDEQSTGTRAYRNMEAAYAMPNVSFDKVKVAPHLRPVYTTRQYSQDDVQYANVPHQSSHRAQHAYA